MTLSEFKAWFEGYTDGMGGQPPNAKQWDAIKAKVDKITGTPVTPVYIERHWPWYYQGYNPPVWLSNSTYTLSNVGLESGNKIRTSGYAYISPDTKGDDITREFNGEAAMYALGKAEAQLQ